MNRKQVIRLSLLSSLLMILNGCGDGSSNKSPETPTQQESNNAGITKAPTITLKGDSQVNIIQGSSYKELGATAVDSNGKSLKVNISGKVDTTEIGSYTLVYTASDAKGRTSSLIRTVQVIARRNNTSIAPTPEKNYYLAPIAKPSTKISNVDLISGELNLAGRDISANKGGLSLTRLYSSYDDKDKSIGTFKSNYESKFDAPLTENIKSKNYATIKAACTQGWSDIDDKAFLGKLENAQAIFNPVTSLCDIYDDSVLLASLLTKHTVSGKSKNLHTLTRPDGSTYVFFKHGDKWQTISKTPLKLKETATGFEITNLSDGIEAYDKEGKLLSLTNMGQTTTLNYGAKGELVSIVDPFGEKIELVYEKGLLKEAKSYDGTSVKYAYNNKKQLTTVTYEDGTTTTYGYNAKGDLESVENSNGVVTKTLSYDGSGKVVSTAGINGVNKTEFDYSNEKTVVSQTTGETDYYFRVLNSKLLTTKRVSDEGESTISYDSHGYPILSTNKFGVVTKTTYDEEGLLVAKTTDADTPEQKITLTSYDVKFRKPTKVVKDGLVTFYDYDDLGHTIKKVVATVVKPNNTKVTSKSLAKMSKATLKTEATSTQVTSFTYNDKGQKTSTTQPNGGSSSTIYDENGNAAKNINALGFETETLEFDKAGRPLKTKDIDGKISTTTYDAMGRVLTSTRDGKTTTNVYDNLGRNIKTTYADGRVEEKKYDATGNVVESWNNQGDKTINTYDANNNLIKTESFKDAVLTNRSETVYDSKNRVIANIDAQGNKTTYTYNAKGQQTEVKDALGRVTKSIYNAKGQLAKTINPDGKATTYTYNADGQRTEVETPNGATFKFAYDSLQRVTQKVNPDRGTTTYTYDVSGNIKTETNAKGETKTYTYDIANRKTSTSYDDATLNESYEYDQGENAKGKLTKITDASGSMEFAYDAKGNLASKTQTINTKTFTTSYTYDEYDRMTSQTYPSGKVIGYEYDAKGELMSITVDGTPFISNIKTNDNGLLSYEYADGSKHTREYDTNGRVTKLSYPNYTEEVNYNVVSNITKIKADSISRAFGYDNLDRLTSYDQNATEFQNFVYDANGNRLTQNQETNKTRRFTYTENSNTLTGIKYYHRVDENTTDVTKEINYKYDKTGNIIQDEKHTYTYDSRNRLTGIDNNVTYQYNYDNKRVSKTVNGVTTYFIYDAHKLVGEYEQNKNLIKEYVYNNSTPIATLTPTKTYRVYADHLDTSRRVATNDNEATIVWKWESKPFGETKATGTLSFNLRFPGQYFDNETKTHYNINRDYNPVTGRYIQSDPIGFDGGVNGFGYVNGQPLTNIDIYGLASRVDEIGGKTFIIDGGTSIERWEVWYITQYIMLGTTRGNQMLHQLKQRMYFERDAWLWFDNPFVINLDIVGKANAPRAYYLEDRNLINIDPDFHPWTQTTKGWRPSETDRIIAHEFGHAVFGDGDVYYMGQPKMRNVILNENPIAREMGLPARTAY